VDERHASMTRRDFAAAARAQSSGAAPSVDGTSEIEELVVAGDWAFMRTRLHVVARDANLLALVRQ
jgi:hypothetical protein